MQTKQYLISAQKATATATAPEGCKNSMKFYFAKCQSKGCEGHTEL